MNEEEAIVLNTPEAIHMYRLIAMKRGLKREMAGLEMIRGTTIYAIIKREFGFRGNRQRVYTQFCEYVEKEKGRLGYGD